MRVEPRLGQGWLGRSGCTKLTVSEQRAQPDTITCSSQAGAPSPSWGEDKCHPRPQKPHFLSSPPLWKCLWVGSKKSLSDCGFWSSLLDGRRVPKGWFTARLAFAETVDGHLEMQHKHVAARKRIKKTQLFPTLEIPGVAPKYYMHPEVIWEMPVCGTFRPSPLLHWVLTVPCHGGERRSPLRPLPPRGLLLKRPLSPAPEAQAGPAALPQPLRVTGSHHSA